MLKPGTKGALKDEDTGMISTYYIIYLTR